MSTTIRPALSYKNKYWIEKHRYYELKHFCLQYPGWKRDYMALDGLKKQPHDLSLLVRTNVISDPTARCAEAKLFYSERMELVERGGLRDRPRPAFLYSQGGHRGPFL